MSLITRLAEGTRRWVGVTAAAVSVPLVLAILVFRSRIDLPLSFVLIVVAIIAAVCLALVRSKDRSGRFLPSVFALALALRLFASLTFHVSGLPYGDKFSGSPDGWKYHVWARYAVESFAGGEPVELWRYDRAGEWTVGFYYVLAGAYLVAGPEPAVGRLLVAIFSALAVLAFHRLARMILDRDGADLATVAWAVWPSTIVWSGYSILKDPLVWLLLLLAAALMIEALRGSWKSVMLLLGVGIALRFVRSYAWFLALGGFGGGVIAAAFQPRFRERAHRYARGLARVVAALLGVEIMIVLLGLPGPLEQMRRYDFGRFVLRPIPTGELPPEFIARIETVPRPVGEPAVPPEARPTPPPAAASPAAASPAAVRSVPVVPPSDPVVSPSASVVPPPDRPRDAPSDATEARAKPGTPGAAAPAAEAARGLPTAPPPVPPDPGPVRRFARNMVRFVLGPFGWTFDVPTPQHWQLAPVWFWYALLPLIGMGFVFGFRESFPMRVVLAVVVIGTLVLITMSRGDAFRQREMLMPGYILAAVVGLRHVAHKRLLLAAAYGTLTLLLIAGMFYHRETLRDRGLIASLTARCTDGRLDGRNDVACDADRFIGLPAPLSSS